MSELPAAYRIPDAEYRKPDIEFIFGDGEQSLVLFVKVIDEVIPTATFVNEASIDRFIMAVNALSRRREGLFREPVPA
jgi:hypothetical protein